MKNVVILIVLGFLVFSCKGTKNTVTPDKVDIAENPSKKRRLPIEDVARFKSVEDLTNFYSDSNPENGTGMFEEATIEREYTILYKDTPDEILFTWQDGKIYDVVVIGNGIWASKAGIRVGMTYDDLAELNRAPLKVYGFGWDYGGAVDWNGGKFENSGLQVFLSPESEGFPEKFYGDSIITPTESELKALALRVTAIVYMP